MNIVRNDDWQQRYAEALRSVGWTCHEPGQSCIDKPHAFKGKQATSIKASLKVLSKTGTQRRSVYDYLLAQGPSTDKEIQAALRMAGNTETPRRLELVQGGFVRATGEERDDSTIWELTGKT